MQKSSILLRPSYESNPSLFNDSFVRSAHAIFVEERVGNESVHFWRKIHEFIKNLTHTLFTYALLIDSTEMLPMKSLPEKKVSNPISSDSSI